MVLGLYGAFSRVPKADFRFEPGGSAAAQVRLLKSEDISVGPVQASQCGVNRGDFGTNLYGWRTKPTTAKQAAINARFRVFDEHCPDRF